MKKIFVSCIFFPVFAIAQTTEMVGPSVPADFYLQQQIQAVDMEQGRLYREQQDRLAKENALREQQARQVAQEKARAQAAAAKRQAAIDAERAQWRTADREAYIARKAAEAKLAEEQVKTEIGRQKAITDVIQSEADATRNVSEGERDLRKGIGEGAKKVSWWK